MKTKKDFMGGYKTYDTSNGYGNSRKWKGAFHERMTGDQANAIILEQEQTPYAILGISPSATQAEIKAAYRMKIMKWHPDVNQHRITEATEMSKKIIAAYTILKQ